jgi:hypothetical protein
MNKDAPGDVMLSMIDVITNGLASLLVLLFMLLITKQQMTWAARSALASPISAAADDPLVILVTSENRAPLFADSATPWRIETDPASHSREHGPQYAAAYFRRPPESGERVQLKLPAKLEGCRARIFSAGRPRAELVFGPQRAGEIVVLWPLEPEEAAP